MRTWLTAAHTTAWTATFLHGRLQFLLPNPATGMDVEHTAQTSSGRPPSHKRTSGVGHKTHIYPEILYRRCCGISKLQNMSGSIYIRFFFKKERCPLQDANENWLILNRSFTSTSCGLKLQLDVVCILKRLENSIFTLN